MKKIIFFLIAFIMTTINVFATEFEKDIFKTSAGDLTITFIAHGTLMMEINDKVIHIDPVGRYADYAEMPKADLILITHEHGDHLDPDAIAKIKKQGTEIILNESCAEQLGEGKVLANGESATSLGIEIDAVPAYNPGKAFHPKGNGNGYILIFGDKKVYVAGDTEDIPEMASLKKIDVAFLPMNQPYTMTPEQVANAARLFNPKILYPYHFGETNTAELVELMKEDKNIEVRIRKLQ